MAQGGEVGHGRLRPGDRPADWPTGKLVYGPDEEGLIRPVEQRAEVRVVPANWPTGQLVYGPDEEGLIWPVDQLGEIRAVIGQLAV